MSEEEIDALDAKVPEIALDALRAAALRAADSGLPRVLMIGDDLVRLHPNGEKEFLRTIPNRSHAVARTEDPK